MFAARENIVCFDGGGGGCIAASPHRHRRRRCHPHARHTADAQTKHTHGWKTEQLEPTRHLHIAGTGLDMALANENEKLHHNSI